MPSLTSKEFREAQDKGIPIAQVLKEKERKKKQEAEKKAEQEAAEKAADKSAAPPAESPRPQAPLPIDLERGAARTRHVREVLDKVFEINPVGKPRQTQQDKWKKRPCVVRYRAYADAVRAQAGGWSVPTDGFRIVFHVEAPKTKQDRAGDAHHLKPDIDNLTKAFFDALEDEDKYIWDCRSTAYWCKMGEGRIQVFTIHETDALDP